MAKGQKRSNKEKKKPKQDKPKKGAVAASSASNQLTAVFQAKGAFGKRAPGGGK